MILECQICGAPLRPDNNQCEHCGYMYKNDEPSVGIEASDLQSFEYRPLQFIGLSVIVFFCTMVFFFGAIFSFPLLALFIFISGMTPGIYLIAEGMNKRRLEVDEGAVRYFKHGVLKETISLPMLVQVTYEFYKSVESGGITRTLSFDRMGGKAIKLRIESMFKERQPAFDLFVAFMETWCKEMGIAFSRKVGLDVKGTTSKELDEMYKHYITPPRGDLKEWKRGMSNLLSLTICGFVAGFACFLPSLGGVTTMTSRLAMMGLIMLVVASCALFQVLDKGLNSKPLRPGKGDVGSVQDEIQKESSPKSRNFISTITGKVLLCMFLFSIATLSPVFFVNTRFTRGLWGIGMSQIAGTFIFIIFIVYLLEYNAKKKKSAVNILISWPTMTSLIFLLSLLAIVLGFIGWFIG